MNIKNTEQVILCAIKESKDGKALYKELSTIDGYWKIKGEHGKNFMHMLAQYAPQFFEYFLLDSFITTTPSKILPLINKSDKDDRTPLEYFLCFGSGHIVEKGMEVIFHLILNRILQKPDWLEVKLLIAETQSVQSGVDRSKMSIWKQTTRMDFNKCLKSERGKKLIHMLANNYRYKNDKIKGYNDDKLYYGMDICKYTDSDIDEYAFLKSAKTEDEVKFSLMQSWRIFFNEAFGVGGHLDPVNNATTKRIGRDFVSELMERAIELGIDVAEMKDKIMESFDMMYIEDEFNNFMSKNLKNWDNLTEITEREKLMKIVKFKPPKSIETYSAL